MTQRRPPRLDPAELLRTLRSRGVVFSLAQSDDGAPPAVRYRAPAGTLDDTDLAELREHKAELVELLNGEAEAAAAETNDSPAAPPAEPPPAQARDGGTAESPSLAIPSAAARDPHQAYLAALEQDAATIKPGPPSPFLWVRGRGIEGIALPRVRLVRSNAIPAAATHYLDRGGEWQRIPEHWRPAP